MNMKQLNDNELVKEYKITRMNFVNAPEFTDEEVQAENIYNELWQEIQIRDIDIRNYIQ